MGPSRKTRFTPKTKKKPCDRSSARASGRHSSYFSAAVRAVARRPRGLAGGHDGELAGVSHGRPAAEPGAGAWPDFLSDGKLARALGHRIPGGRAQRLHAADRGGDRGHRHDLRAGDCREPYPPACQQAALVLHGVPAVSDRPAGDHDYRRRLQRLRISGNLVAVELRVDQHRPRPPRADRRLSVPDHGHDRRHVHFDRHRPAVRDDRHLEHGGSGRPHPGGGRHPHRARRVRLSDHRRQPQAGAVSAPPLAAQRLRLCALGGDGLPGGHRHQGSGLRAAALLLHHFRGQILV